MLKIELELTESDEDMLKSLLDREFQRLSGPDRDKPDTLATIVLCHKICLACSDAQDMQAAEMN